MYNLNSGVDPIILETVGCVGNETNILSCPTSPIGNISTLECQQPNRAAGIMCTLVAGSCIDGQVRLVDGPSYYEGRLEVCRNNQWLSVCDFGFDNAAATRVCSDQLLLQGCKLLKSFIYLLLQLLILPLLSKQMAQLLVEVCTDRGQEICSLFVLVALAFLLSLSFQMETAVIVRLLICLALMNVMLGYAAAQDSVSIII